ncbi:DUF6318 family protein [Kribbella sp. VKM Ac-2569]|uniref:DUF6318 family protein n=1 Tax=Kribbella sp. VKM Ac-2569 TaxID=2512220 RepID=UPI00102B3FF2|nr:DUF6318 family protein [Kribbella sp. VKM Ac-2569]
MSTGTSTAPTNETSASPGASNTVGTPPPTLPTAPPGRPKAAAGATLAAGEAFIGYYVDLLNYSYGTGDSGPLLAASDKGCLGCKAIADYVLKINLKNGTLEGDYKDRLIDVKEIFRGSSGRLGGSATLKSGTFTERDSPSASPVPQGGDTGTMEFTLSPSGGNWVMYEMEIK